MSLPNSNLNGKKVVDKNFVGIIDIIKKNKLLVLVILAYLVLLVAMPGTAYESGKNSMYYVKEMLQIMPVIFILTSLIEAWVPRQTIIKGFGENSGIKGSIFSFLLGSFSAGPIYAAFPICKMLLKKGASVSNVVIILSSWAVVKVPMLANEAKFLGPKFMAIRWVLTTISIFIMAYIVSKLVKKETIPFKEESASVAANTLSIKQQYCIGCGVCVKMAPENFKMSNGKAHVMQQPYIYSNTKNEDSEKEITLETNKKVNTAIEKCPAKAIYWN